ncbi:hypothetical protein GCM10023184_10640 [Flaviaesturariibacter amylovorans]|uniref:TonB-dependent receptor n=2 Tax=Flaviaesturariibacter amylovorans TaxID=1084520 RepID=A0ABP8GFZ9_9BACT
MLLFSAFLGKVSAQDIRTISKQKPLTLSGSIGASSHFFSSGGSDASRPPHFWNVHGSLTPTLYGISLPLSFTVNQYGGSYAQPFTQFGISPTYKWLKVHLGYRNMSLSPLVFEGQSFRGAGIELNPGKLRFAAFYGNLNKAVNEDTTSGRYRVPQFTRKAMGGKIGFGSERNYFDIIGFYAKDDSASARVLTKSNQLRPQENLVGGISFKFTFFKRLSLSADLAGSLHNQDEAARKIHPDSFSNNTISTAARYLPLRYSSVLSYAGQAHLQLATRFITTRIGYRHVAPDFKTLGTPYMLNDIRAITANTNLTLAKGRVNLNLNAVDQRNNLDGRAVSELRHQTGNLAFNAMIGQKLNLGFNATGVFLRQKDGILRIKDSVRLRQDIFNISFYPTYSFSRGKHAHSITLNINNNRLQDHNPVTAQYSALDAWSLNAGYNRQNVRSGIGLLVNVLYNSFAQPANRYSAYGGTVGASAQLLKERNLGLQASVGYQHNDAGKGNGSSNIIYNGNINWRLKKHVLSGFANYVRTPPVLVTTQVPYLVASDTFYGGLSYSYTF